MLLLDSLREKLLSPWIQAITDSAKHAPDLESVLAQVSIAARKQNDQKASWEEKGLFVLHFQVIIHHWRKSGQELNQGWNLEAGADIESMEGSY